jgi:hypothetical protein
MSGNTLAVRADAVFYRLVWWPCASGGMWVLAGLRLTRPSRRAGRVPVSRAHRAASRWR